jgi:hypothetical protein
LKLTDKAKRSIHTWSAGGLGPRAIATRLGRELGISVSHVAVAKFLAKEPPAASPKSSSRRSSPSPSPAPPSAEPDSPAPPAAPAPANEEDDAAEELRILRRLRRLFFRSATRTRATTLDRRRATETLLEVLEALRLQRPTTPANSEAAEQLQALASAALERLRKLR